MLSSGVIPLIVNRNSKVWFTSGGLAQDIFYIIVIQSVAVSFSTIFDTDYIFKWMRRYVELKNPEKTSLNQFQANK